MTAWALNTRVQVERGGVWCAGTITGFDDSIDARLDPTIDVDLDRPERTGARTVWCRPANIRHVP